MSSTKTARSRNAAENADAIAATPSDWRSELFRTERMHGGVRLPPSGNGMSDAMRTIVWVTGVAFGVFAPGAFSQSAIDAGDTRPNPVFQKLDPNHDGFVSRDEAKQYTAVNAVFCQADMNKDGKPGEDELIKALSISQGEAVEKTAVDGASAAGESGVKSVLNDLTAK